MRIRYRYMALMVLAVIALVLWLSALAAARRRGDRISRCPRCRSDMIRPS